MLLYECYLEPFGERKILPGVLSELHLGKEKPVMGNIEPLFGITKPAEGLNKPCQGNRNGRKYFAAEGFNMKILFISQTYTTAVAISFRQNHARTRNLMKYHPRVIFTESFHGMVMYQSNRSFNIPPGIPRAFDAFSCPGGREFDHQPQGLGNLIISLNVMIRVALIPHGLMNVIHHGGDGVDVKL